MRSILSTILIVLWVMGLVIAKGFWSTLFAVLVAPWAWYLSVEHIMILNGWL